MTGQDSTGDLTRLTVNLTPRATAAMHAAGQMLGVSNTDTVNISLMLLAQVTGIATLHEGAYWAEYPDFDERGSVWLLVTRERPKKRRWPW
jgi:hypothetical protein